MTKRFEKDDKVVISLPNAPEDGMTGRVVQPCGAGTVKIHGIKFTFEQSYLLNIDGIGTHDKYGNPMVYPVEFLDYVEPPTFFERSTWVHFDRVMAALGVSLSYQHIKDGANNNGSEKV